MRDSAQVFDVPKETLVASQAPLGLASIYFLAATDQYCPSPTAALRVEARFTKPIQSGEATAVTQPNSQFVKIAICDSMGTAMIGSVEPGAALNRTNEQVPILEPCDLLSVNLNDPYSQWWQDRFEIRPLPVGGRSVHELDAWVRQNGPGIDSPWSTLLAVDVWTDASPSASPKARDNDESVRPYQLPVDKLEMIVQPSARNFEADQWVLRRSRWLFSTNKKLSEIGTVTTRTGKQLLVYRALRTL